MLKRLQGWMPDSAQLIFTVRTFAAAILALYLALALGLPRPYWAMATAYIASQPLSGATRSKAVYRGLGTLLGASAAVLMVPALVDAPELLSLAMALWTGACLIVALLDRTPRSYVAMLAAYTAPLIAFPTVSDPGTVFDVASARVQEILLGVVCAAVLSSVVLPQSVASVLATRLRSWLGDVERWGTQALAGNPTPATAVADRRRLAAGLAEIDAMVAQLDYDPGVPYGTGASFQLLRARMLAMLPVLSSVSDRMAALTAGGRPLPQALVPLLDAVRDWLRWEPAGASTAAERTARADALQTRIDGQIPRPAESWDDALRTSLLLRLKELVDLVADCRELRARLRGEAPHPLRTDEAPGALYRDWGMVLWSAGAAALAVLIACAIWIGTAWPDGAVVAEIVAVGCCFFAAQDNPVPAILSFMTWSAVAVVIDGIYLFGILPAVHDFAVLVVVLAPAYLLFGLLVARPSTAIVGMALAANGATLLALQDTYSADFATFVNSGLAFIAGMLLAAVITAIVRSVGADWSAQRLLRAGWRDLAAAAEGRGRENRVSLASVFVDRMGQLAPRLATSSTDAAAVDVLTEIRVGLNILRLRAARRTLPQVARTRVEAVLADIAAFYRGRLGHRLGVLAAPATLLVALDRALAALAPNPGADEALQGLVGLRRGLFPESAGPGQDIEAEDTPA